MANWKYSINIRDAWRARRKGEITLQALCKNITFHLKRLKPYKDKDETLLEIVEWFESMIGERYVDLNEFDFWMDDLYDWGDQEVEPLEEWPPNKMCWIGVM